MLLSTTLLIALLGKALLVWGLAGRPELSAQFETLGTAAAVGLAASIASSAVEPVLEHMLTLGVVAVVIFVPVASLVGAATAAAVQLAWHMPSREHSAPGL